LVWKKVFNPVAGQGRTPSTSEKEERPPTTRSPTPVTSGAKEFLLKGPKKKLEWRRELHLVGGGNKRREFRQRESTKLSALTRKGKRGALIGVKMKGGGADREQHTITKELPPQGSREGKKQANRNKPSRSPTK